MTQPLFLPLLLFPPAGYYAAIASGGEVYIDARARYDKRQKAVHRYEIIDARGLLQLTVPVSKPHGCDHEPTWADVAVSTHDEWWRRHRTALESAYGRTPYFEFLIDSFEPVFRSPEQWETWPDVIDLIKEANKTVCHIIGIDTKIHYRRPADDEAVADLRRCNFYVTDQPPYWQVRAAQHGFAGGLSVLDLLFNLGPESAIYLNDNQSYFKHLIKSRLK